MIAGVCTFAQSALCIVSIVHTAWPPCTVTVAALTRPARLRSGSHFDEYVADYISYKAGAPASSVFNPPAECAGVVAEKAPSSGPRAFVLRMLSVMPSTARLGALFLHPECDLQM